MTKMFLITVITVLLVLAKVCIIISAGKQFDSSFQPQARTMFYFYFSSWNAK